MRVDAEHPWKWPQNLIYGVHFRVYYDPAKKPHPTGQIASLESGAKLGRSVRLQVEATVPPAQIRQVDYVGHYEDVNYEGDGLYTQWHYHFFHGKIVHHLGSAGEAPWQVGLGYVLGARSEAADGDRCPDCRRRWHHLHDAGGDRPGLRSGRTLGRTVQALRRPEEMGHPSGEMSERFDVTGDLKKAVAAQLVWSSWSPGYMRGISINGVKVSKARVLTTSTTSTGCP